MSIHLAEADPDAKDELVSIGALLQKLLTEVKADFQTETPIAFDLGCGLTPALGFTGVDFHCDASVRCDLFSEWDFAPDGGVDAFYSSHFVEHVPDWNRFFEQAWRKLRIGGYFMITTPYYLSVRATQDPDHKQMISTERYAYLSREWRKANNINHYPKEIEYDFEVVTLSVAWNADFAHLSTAQETNPKLAEYHMKHTPNAVDDLTVVLRKRA